MPDDSDGSPLEELPLSDDDARVERTLATPGAEDPDEPKRCWVCGTDTRGHRRLKEQRGYICVPCAKARDASRVRCPTCNRKVKPELMQKLGNKRVCQRCYTAMKDDPRYKVFKVDTSGHDEADKKKLYVLGAVVGVLLLIILLNQLGVIGA